MDILRLMHGALDGRATGVVYAGGMSYDVTVSYPLDLFTGEACDAKIIEAAGRVPDFSGTGLGTRDLGWECTIEEVGIIAEKLRAAGYEPRIEHT